VSQSHREIRQCFLDHPALRIEGACARAVSEYRTPEDLTAISQIILPIRGAFVYELGSSQSLLTANHALFIAAGDASRDRFVDEQPLDYMLITPGTDQLSALAGDAVQEQMRLQSGTRVAGSPARLQHAASTFWNLCMGDSWVDATEKVELGVELLVCALQSAGFSQPARRSAANRLVGAVKDLIGTGSQRLSLTDIAAQLDASPTYLTDLFRRNEGISIANYQRRLRLSRALFELPHAEDLTALALDLGFSSHAHFSTAFRAMYGETPSVYRGRVRAGSQRARPPSERI